ncbi:hypothetical protein [Fenollaria sporofastidiosus]|uniref:hypothetical protein n=1 Tax=Fenollaria sporofastidiosus TaxID=2811778 RepID=UPI001C007FC9|nr:hypothetical protein [Fenollaria sporofastidiosus]
MNENFVYDEFNPKTKGGRASGITEIFQATNAYIKGNIKAILCFALVYIVLIGGFLALNVGSIMQISSDTLNLQMRNNDQVEMNINGINDLTNELDDAESFDDVMNSVKNFRDNGGLNDRDLNAFMNITRTSVLMILSFLIMGIAIQLIAIAFVTHVNKWIFKMERGAKEVTESLFIKLIKSIAIMIIFGLISGATAIIFGIIGAIIGSYEAIVILMTLVLALVNFYIGLAGSIAYYLVTTNKYIGIGTCISAAFGIVNRFILNWIGKMILIYIATFVVGGFATLIIAFIATGLRAPWVFALAAVPWIFATLYSTVYSQMALCDYTSQYEFRTGRVVRDYDYYDIYDDDGYDYTDRPKRYQNDEARSVDDFYNSLDN